MKISSKQVLKTYSWELKHRKTAPPCAQNHRWASDSGQTVQRTHTRPSPWVTWVTRGSGLSSSSVGNKLTQHSPATSLHVSKADFSPRRTDACPTVP